MDAFASRLARPIRDRLEALGYRAIIVTDEPLLRGSFDPESKVSSYVEASDAFVALCSHDDRAPGSTAQNIIDEIGRARSHPFLRDVVCVLKEAKVTLPSNINPVWNALDPDEPAAAFGVIRRQLEAWGIIPTVPSAPLGTPLPTGLIDDLFDGVDLGDHDKAEGKIRLLFATSKKSDQRRVLQEIFEYAMSLGTESARIHIVTSFLEAANRIDPALVNPNWIEQLTMSEVTQHRISAAMMLWDRAETVPGSVPLDLVARLAKPATEDWYVFAPALAATKQLALSRKSALNVIVDLARSQEATDRDYAIAALVDLARVDPALIPVEPVERLARDSDPGVAERAATLLERVRTVTEAERNMRYGQFGL